MNYTAAIEQLDQKLHRPVTMDDWKRIADKPGATLTDDDITICGYFGGPSSAAAAHARREKALNPAAPEPPPPVTTSAPVRSNYVTRTTLSKEFEGYTKALVEIVKAQTARIDAQDAEIAALKSTAYLKDAGIWRHGTTYAAGDVAQFSGSPWVCTRAHTATGPTADHTCWRLWVKSGKNGKDAR